MGHPPETRGDKKAKIPIVIKMKITAKLLDVENVNQISSSFKKREFVVEYSENPKFTEYLKFELIQDKCDLINSFAPGQEIEIEFNLKGRKWTDPKGQVKYFNSLQAWKLSVPTHDSQTPGGDDIPSYNEPPGWLEDESETPF